MRRPVLKQFKKGTLKYCEISPVRVTYISPIISSSLDTRKKWLKKVIGLGEKLK
ncbi:MAG: NAD(P)H dehydrogenase (quinone) [Saprospiraceae bacterium]|jgi:NAD(P)H dehydrogenase (quinone)